VWARVRGLGLVLRQEAYEAAIGLACVASGWSAVRGVKSAAAARVLPVWSIRPLEALLCLGGLLTLGALVTVGLTLDEVRKVLARRVEQSGQVLVAGLFFAVAVGAFGAGAAGIISGALYTALAAASAVRAGEIGALFRAAGRLP
jgi:hypothetical protein